MEIGGERHPLGNCGPVWLLAPPMKILWLLSYYDKNLQPLNSVKMGHKSIKHRKKENYSKDSLVKPAYLAIKAPISLASSVKDNQEEDTK